MTTFSKRALCIAAVAGIFATAASAEQIQSGDLIFEIDGSEATVVGWSTDFYNPEFNIVIPNTVSDGEKEYPVTALRNELFYSMGITSITLGDNVRELGDYTFMYCSNLTEVNLNEGLKKIGLQCFANCSSVSEISLPSTLEEIGSMAFWNASLSGEINLPASVKKINVAPWRSDVGITAINVDPASEYYTSENGVLFTKDMETVVTYPAGKPDTSYTLPSSVKEIADQSMRNNPNMSELVMPEGLEKIGEMALASSALTSIELPSTVKSIGGAAFFYGLKLTEFKVASGNKWFRSENGFLIENDVEKIVAAVPMSGSLAIPEGIKAVGDYAFYMSGLTDVTFPSSLRSTGKASFANCNDLKTVELNEGLETIGPMSFQDSPILTGIKFPSTLKKMEMQAFCGCNGLKEAILPDGLETLESTIFFMCSGLERVYLPGSVKYFEHAIFSVCENLKEAVIGEGITELPNSMFNMDWSLTDVTLPSTLEVIGQYSLYGAAFSHIDLPAGLKRIDEAGLYGTGLETLDLPDSVEELGPFALAWNFNMTSLKTGKNLKRMGHNAIHFMTSLEEVTLNEGLEEIDDYGISTCTVLKTLTIPSTVSKIGDSAFYNDPLELVVNLATTPQVLESPIIYTPDGDLYDTCVLSVPAESLEAYKQAEIWKLFLHINGDAETGVEEINSDSSDLTIKDVYTLDGRRVSNPDKGVYIFRMSDGSTQKRVIR